MASEGANFNQFFWLILIAFIVALIARRLRAPYSLSLVVTGLIVGMPRLLPAVHLDPTVLMMVFLPPLLFESALNLHIDMLKQDWKPIAIYTVLGTIASTAIIGYGAAVILHIAPVYGLLFGALISTTDPISVIAVFRRLGAPRRLSRIMEAESLFNNDTAVVLFTLVMGQLSGGVSLAMAPVSFVILVAGGAAVGIAIGALASRVHYELNDHLIEITLTTVVAYSSYLLAEKLHVSGVIAVVAAGIVLGSYGMQTSMSPSTRLAVAAFWEYAAFVVNSIVFLLIGIEVAYINWTHRVLLALGASVLVLLGRTAIYPISLLVNRLGGKIARKWQHVMVWGGLRGALSMALALGLDPKLPYRDSIVAATFGVVLFSLLVQGSTLPMVLKRLNLTQSESVTDVSPELRNLEAQLLSVQGGLTEIDRLRTAEAHPSWALKQLSDEYMERRNALFAALEQLQPGYRASLIREFASARSAVLLGAKSALADAEKLEFLDGAAGKQMAADIDAELLALRDGLVNDANE